MNLPLIEQHLSAICIDHVLPTSTGAHVHTEPISTRNQDPRVQELATMPGRDGHIYLSFGAEIDGALARAVDAPGAGRGRAVLYQFLHQLPAEAVDRAVLRPLKPDALTLSEIAARADAAGLPVEIGTAGLRAPQPGEPPVDPSRLLGFTSTMELTTVADADVLWVAPLRHWAPGAYADASAEVRDAALSTPYPVARMVFNGADGVQLGMPAALAAHAHGAALAGIGRQLGTQDLPDTPGRTLPGYGDLLAAMAQPGARGLVRVESVSGISAVFLAVHDASGLAFLDPATGTAAVFPPAPGRIVLHPADGTGDLASLLPGTQAAPVTAPAARTINRSSRMQAVPLGDSGRVLDVIGRPDPRSKGFLTGLASAAAEVDAPVVLVATELGTAPTQRQLRDLGWLLLQHQRNVQAGGPVPVVVIRGDAPPAVSQLLDRYDFAVVQQPGGALGRAGGGFSMNLDNPWVGRNASGTQLSAPARAITGDLLRSVTDSRPAQVKRLPADDTVLDFVATPLEDVAAVRSMLAEHGSALKTLAPQISALGVQQDEFVPWEAMLRIDGGGDTALAAAAFDYLGAGTEPERKQKALSFVPALIGKDPAARGDGFTDLIDLTKGPLDDGASRAVLAAVQVGIEGGSLDQIKQQIFQHSAYLPQTGRTDWIRELRGLMQRMPEHSALFEQVAVFVETCP